jgi:tight adherence protein C
MGALAVSLASFGCIFCFVCVAWERTAKRRPAAWGRPARVNEAASGSIPLWALAAPAAIFALTWTIQHAGGGAGIRVPLLWSLGTAAAVWGWTGARAWHRQQAWKREITNGLIDVLDLWILCLDAGMSFQAALARVTQDAELARPALRRELQVTLQEILAGCPRDEAMKNMARRCPGIPELSGLVSHIVQAEKLGSSFTKTLQICANTLRFNRYQDMKQQVQVMPVKLAFPLIFCILPCLLIVISGPALVRLFEVLSRQ